MPSLMTTTLAELAAATETAPAWHLPRLTAAASGFMFETPTATELVELHPAVIAGVRARPVLAEAIGRNADTVRQAIRSLRRQVENDRKGWQAWNPFTARQTLARLRTARRLHRDAIGSALRAAGERRAGA